MKTKSKKVHFHICGTGADAHRWAHDGEARHVARVDKKTGIKFYEGCGLSTHALCGFSQANDCPLCIRKRALPPKRFDYKVDANGYAILYHGQEIGKNRLTLKEQKVKRHPMTVKKDARQYEFSAQKIVAMLDDGNGDKKLWAKIRKIDRQGLIF